ncbi:MAG TPA: NAD(P)H-hydrate dehydratase [Kofleriaceae bacterium]|nr:NAD(P)H-hydrate dehydratase [Kofleriaceae bacterium]
MKPVVTAAEMRALDRATIEDVGLPGIALMETAGRAVAAAAARMVRPPAHVAVVCGAGGNGGDGFVCARVLRELGYDAVAYLAVPRDGVAGDARQHLAILERAGGVVRAIDTPERLGELADAIAGAALAVDALFGIGLARAIEGHLADVVSLVNHAPRRLAVDIPSGLAADTGRVLGVAVSAERTVTMGALKIALASAPGFARAGAVEVADIGIPGGLVAAQAVRAGLVEEADVARWLPRAAALDHKGRRGHVVVVGGMPGMRGAGRLASMAALRAGAGLVTLASAGDVHADDSVMTRSLESSLGELLENKDALVIGPGLGQSDLAAGWVAEVLAAGVPAVLDADALNLVAGVGEGTARSGPLAHHPNGCAAIARAAGPIVLTPHPGEAARLLGQTVADVEADRLAAARVLAARTHAVVVLKGARTIVCDGTLGDEFCAINASGGPELATGGSGDVLTGVIAALIAQGVAPALAARAGVHVHGRAGDELAARHGTRGVVSSDLPPAIAGVISRLA